MLKYVQLATAETPLKYIQQPKSAQTPVYNLTASQSVMKTNTHKLSIKCDKQVLPIIQLCFCVRGGTSPNYPLTSYGG